MVGQLEGRQVTFYGRDVVADGVHTQDDLVDAGIPCGLDDIIHGDRGPGSFSASDTYLLQNMENCAT